MLCTKGIGFEIGWFYDNNPELALEELIELSNGTDEYFTGFELYISRKYNQTLYDYCLSILDVENRNICLNQS
jgi:hypothetical protein